MTPIRWLTTRHRLLLGYLAAALFAPALSLSDDRYGGEPEVEVHDNGKDYKYEYKDGRCKYEYKYNYRTGEEKTEKKGDCRGVSPGRAVYYSDEALEAPWPRDDREYDRDRDDDYEEHPRNSRRLACNREVIGQVLGGIAGGAAGAQVGSGSGRRAATIAGAVIGTIIGGNVGRRMDRSDAACAYQAFEFAGTDETVYWRNPDSDIEYGITPQRRIRREGRECREYEASVRGRASAAHGLACRRADGSWEIQAP